jgi:mRNA-degrading endonuclease RelE of RelBE toxin-antitoxin system
MKFVFTNHAKKQFIKLDQTTQKRIKDKLLILKQDKQLLEQNIKPVINLELIITHRLRIGSHRLLLKEDSDNYIILKVGHRKNIYK